MQVRHALACLVAAFGGLAVSGGDASIEDRYPQQEEAQCLFLLSFLKRKEGRLRGEFSICDVVFGPTYPLLPSHLTAAGRG